MLVFYGFDFVIFLNKKLIFSRIVKFSTSWREMEG